MRELTKSVMRFSWAMPLFAVRQAASLATAGDWMRPTQATAAFDAVSAAAEAQLGATLHRAFDLGDKVQRGAVDALFKLVDLGSDCTTNRTSGRVGSCQ